MALATRCPHCKTTFRVASDQLKLRGGIVRCGTCNQVFDGNASLVDLDAIEHKTPPPAPAWIPPPAPVEVQALDEQPLEFSPKSEGEPAPELEIAPEPAPQAEPEPEPEPEPELEIAAQPPGPSASDAFDAQIAAIEASAPIVLAPGYVLDFDLSDPLPAVLGNAPVADDYSGPATQLAPDMEPDLDFERLNDREFDPPVPDDGELSLADEIGAGFSSDPAPATRPVPDLEGPLPLLRASSDVAPPEPEPLVPVPAPAPQEPDHDEPDFVRLAREQEQAAWRRRLTMGAGSVLLALLLLGQGITTFRNQLVARYPALKPAMVAGCALLRCQIELPAQIDTLVVETGELQSLSNGTFQLTTLLRNESGLTQAWPYIELELTDANDKPVVRRVFTPPQYLPQGVLPAKGFGAHSEQPVKIHFELKQLKASGFHIAVFYP